MKFKNAKCSCGFDLSSATPGVYHETYPGEYIGYCPSCLGAAQPVVEEKPEKSKVEPEEPSPLEPETEPSAEPETEPSAEPETEPSAEAGAEGEAETEA